MNKNWDLENIKFKGEMVPVSTALRWAKNNGLGINKWCIYEMMKKIMNK